MRERTNLLPDPGCREFFEYPDAFWRFKGTYDSECATLKWLDETGSKF